MLLLPNSESFFFFGRCGDINLTGVNIDTDPCVRDGTDGTYELVSQYGRSIDENAR